MVVVNFGSQTNFTALNSLRSVQVGEMVLLQLEFWWFSVFFDLLLCYVHFNWQLNLLLKVGTSTCLWLLINKAWFSGYIIHHIIRVFLFLCRVYFYHLLLACLAQVLSEYLTVEVSLTLNQVVHKPKLVLFLLLWLRVCVGCTWSLLLLSSHTQATINY